MKTNSVTPKRQDDNNEADELVTVKRSDLEYALHGMDGYFSYNSEEVDRLWEAINQVKDHKEHNK